ncbi:MAG: hypothetical protein HY912_16330 [Desulfomonile tiedjei]|uniref:Uncharacterized protein n=1 Tax=Desulfomonile tiedjei TaxID=2358 RepID=A0A9D6V3X2_9BACT|nr:hypothetical protein [Desulfomonile tiedjei]
MADVEDYTTGKVLNSIKQTFDILESVKGSLKDSKIGNRILEETRKLDPRRGGPETIARLIVESEKCAIGERVCRALYNDSPFTESVFLNELADGMVAAGKAKYANKEEALEILRKYPRNPIVVSRVSGQDMEICNTWPERCVYWNLQKRGLKCIANLD